MNKYIYTSLLILLFAVQIFVPVQMVYQQEETISKGTEYKFKTEPIDPTDPFRGKYIILNYEIDSYQSAEEDWPEKAEIFVYLKTDDAGFAAIKTISKTKMDTNDDFVRANAFSTYDGYLRIDYPFNRFYMNENKAYDAELSVRQAQRDTAKICYGMVYVRGGTAVLENVFIDDTPIQQYVETYQKEVQ